MGRSQQSRRRPLGRLGLGGLAVVTAVAAAVLALGVAPPERIQGQAQRLMYLHVPAAWTAYLAFAVAAVAGIAVLLRGGARWDARVRAAAELGVGMTGLTLLEGSIWGHSAWGVWWTWDPRLVSTALLFLVYVAYLALRALPGDEERTSRRAAAVAVAGFALVPVVHFSVLWFRTLHQPPTLLRPDLEAPIAASMLAALLTSLVAFTLAGAWFFRRRVAQLAPADGPTAPAAPAVPAAGSRAAYVVSVPPVAAERRVPAGRSS